MRHLATILALAVLLCSGCASSRKASRSSYQAEKETSSQEASTRTTQATATATDTTKAQGTTSTTSRATTTGQATVLGQEEASTTYTHNPAGQLVASRTVTTSRGTTSSQATTDTKAVAEFMASWARQMASQQRLVERLERQASTTTREEGQAREVVTVGKPWYYWPLRLGIALAVLAVLWYVGWPLLLAFLRKRKTAQAPVA